MTPLATVTVHDHDGVPVAGVRGEIDLSNTPQVSSEIIRAVSNEAPGAVVDLTDLTYLDSAGVRMLYDLRERLAARSQALHVVTPRAPVVRRLVTIAGVAEIVPLHETLDDALAALRADYRQP